MVIEEEHEFPILTVDAVVFQLLEGRLCVLLIEQPYAFDAPDRDPRGNSVSIMYIGLCRAVVPFKHKQTKYIQNPTFTPVDGLPALAYDHQDIINFALRTLRSQAMTTGVVANLLPHLHHGRAAKGVRSGL